MVKKGSFSRPIFGQQIGFGAQLALFGARNHVNRANLTGAGRFREAVRWPLRPVQTRLTRLNGNYNLVIHGDLRFLVPSNRRPVIAVA